MLPLKKHSMTPRKPVFDPAPSRVMYRWNRLWLTPSFRKAVRVVIPFALAAGGVLAWASDEKRVNLINDTVVQVRKSVEERPEFMVNLMAVDGASPGLTAGIREVMPVHLPASSFDLDLEVMKAQVEELDAVKRVDVRIKAGGLLQVDVLERTPSVIWRNADGLVMLDDAGHRVRKLELRADRPDLPLIAGVDAEKQVSEALALINEADPIKDRVMGLVRVSALRWDVVLDREQRIMLPADDPLGALARVLALHESTALLDRDLARVDVRNGNRPTLRLTPEAAKERRVAMGFEERTEEE
ncbi:MAG: cell division protein FtsQ/DivIB [Litoreibacter sp.]